MCHAELDYFSYPFFPLCAVHPSEWLQKGSRRLCRTKLNQRQNGFVHGEHQIFGTPDWETYLQHVRIQVAQTHQQTLPPASAVRTHTTRLKNEWAKVLASVAWVWLHAAVPDPLENRTRATCKLCKRFSSIVINLSTTISFTCANLSLDCMGTESSSTIDSLASQ